PSEKTGEGDPPSAPEKGFGTITGKIVIDSADEGSLPSPEAILFAVGKAPVDNTFCASEMAIRNESFIVNPMTRGVQNVFIYLEEMPDDGKKVIATQKTEFWPSASKENLVLDQQNCTYKPHAMLVKAGEAFTANSQDSVVHSYRGTPFKNSPFNENVNPNSSLKVNPYRRPEPYPVPISCATHSWMSGYQLPLSHPYAAVTNDKGEFQISDLPTGEHEFIIWHENKGSLGKGVVAKQKVTVNVGENDLGELTFRLNQFKK
ncbi:MAG: hypothetical protein KDA84_22925, partial [Planctomycetaceae bacterium]|nr:hypothetical protein [Planctomycetaceae bacterium]